MEDSHQFNISRREMIVGTAAAVTAIAVTKATGVQAAEEVRPAKSSLSFILNGTRQNLQLDNRTTLLDALREHVHLTGTKKGCDQGQCGACTVIVNGRRINSCLTLALQHQDDEITTIEGLGTPENLHAMQAAFIKHDGYQCGYCTSGQICSAVSVLEEIKAGIPSHVTGDLLTKSLVSGVELRERMSGNICRCGAYSNIIEAMSEVALGDSKAQIKT